MAYVIDESFFGLKIGVWDTERDHTKPYNYDIDPLKSSNLKEMKENSSETQNCVKGWAENLAFIVNLIDNTI